jgi:TIR domain
MTKIAFISHASEDAAIAEVITEYLEKNGVSCWMAPRDADPGSDYSSEIIEAIEASTVFVLVLSENANESVFVKREVERAVSKGKPVFPIRVREVLPSKALELFISSAHWIDAWKPPLEKYLARLAQAISAAAAAYPAGAPPAVLVPANASASSTVRNQRCYLMTSLAAIVALLMGGAGWYAYRLFDSSRSASSQDHQQIDTRSNVDEPLSMEPGAARAVATQPLRSQGSRMSRVAR